MWPFGKKNQSEGPVAEAEAVIIDSVAPAFEEATVAVHDDASEAAAENTSVDGPFDTNSTSPIQFNFSGFAKTSLSPNSMPLPIPHVDNIQVGMGSTGSTMLHIATEHGHVTPVAFVAPMPGGLWEESAQEIKDGLESGGLDAHVEQGPWGFGVVSHTSDMEMRIIGTDDLCWVLHITALGPVNQAGELTDLTRGPLIHSFIFRGEDPMSADQPFSVTLPSRMVGQIRRAYQQQTQTAQAEDRPGRTPGATGTNPNGFASQFGQPTNIENLAA